MKHALALWLALLAAPTPLAFARAQSAPAAAQPAPRAFDQQHAAFSALLARHVHGDRVDYKVLKAERAPLDAYLASLAAVQPAELDSWSKPQQFAFFLNAYNAHVLRLVIDAYPVDSIKDLGGLFSSVWSKEFIPLDAFKPGGKRGKLSLDELEHKILRVRFADARMHAAINCASLGCPPLRAEAFTADKLEQQLDQQMRAFVNDARRNRFDPKAGRAELSQIFEWFEADFRRDAGSVAAFVQRYLPGSPADSAWLAKARITQLDYSWALNDLERAR